jgi:hypothetical protein
MNRSHIVYTMKHKRAFLRVEKELLGHNTVRGFLHDLDKVFVYLVTPKIFQTSSYKSANKSGLYSDDY